VLFFNIGHQALQRGPLHRRAGQPAIVVMSLDQPPTLARLTADEGFTGLALCMQRIELLLQTLFRRFARIDRAAA
jgi:hypothetical protein